MPSFLTFNIETNNFISIKKNKNLASSKILFVPLGTELY